MPISQMREWALRSHLSKLMQCGEDMDSAQACRTSQPRGCSLQQRKAGWGGEGGPGARQRGGTLEMQDLRAAQGGESFSVWPPGSPTCS